MIEVPTYKVEAAPLSPPPLPEPDAPSGADAAPDDETSGAAAEPQGEPPPPLTPKALVDLVEGANVLAIAMVVRTQKGQADAARVAELQRFDPNTRALLEGLAPSAIPYVQRWIGDHSLMGALAFAGVAGMAIAGNMAAARRLVVNVKAERPRPPFQPDPEPARAQMGEPPPSGFPGWGSGES